MLSVGNALLLALTAASLDERPLQQSAGLLGVEPAGTSGTADAPYPVHASQGGRKRYRVMASCTPKTNALLIALLPLGRMMYCRSGVTESQRVTVIW